MLDNMDRTYVAMYDRLSESEFHWAIIVYDKGRRTEMLRFHAISQYCELHSEGKLLFYRVYRLQTPSKGSNRCVTNRITHVKRLKISCSFRTIAITVSTVVYLAIIG